jgi:hypothetical protein
MKGSQGMLLSPAKGRPAARAAARLVVARDDGAGWWAGAARTEDTPNRPWVRWTARLLASYLDRRLARGQPPEGSRLLAARAVRLVSPPFRFALASNWQRLLAGGDDRARALATVPIRRAEIQALESELCRVVAGLIVPGPVPARGVAMASVLISDGAGPLYRGSGLGGLSRALRTTVEHLDPLSPLV